MVVESIRFSDLLLFRCSNSFVSIKPVFFKEQEHGGYEGNSNQTYKRYIPHGNFIMPI